MKINIVFLLSMFTCTLSYGQTSFQKIHNFEIAQKDSIVSQEIGDLIINNDIVLPDDSLETMALFTSLNGFLSAAYQNTQNDWILPTEIIETQMLIDEIVDIKKSENFKHDSFFKAYITNIIPINEDDYLIKISYLGAQGISPIVRANFELVAHKKKGNFLISSPLIRYTQNWKTKKYQNHIFHYPFTIDQEKIRKFADKVMFYDEKLDNNVGEFHYYLQEDGMDPIKLFGVEYKSDYNGYALNSRWVTMVDNKTLWVANEARVFGYDIHDLWHNRLGLVIPRKEVHRRVDCHIATLHGGIWGFTWEELFPTFYNNFVIESNIDWLDHKKNGSHFFTNGLRGKRKNYTDDFVGALIVEKIENERGFDGVLELLKTKRTKDEKEYFEVLERLTGITKDSYNEEVSKLIDAEIKKYDL